MNLVDAKIGCIGTGNMGEAILGCLSKSLKKSNLYCYDADQKKMKECIASTGVMSAESSTVLAEFCDIIIIAVKPDIVRIVAEEIKNVAGSKLIISNAAGISTKYIRGILGEKANIVRVMPNTPALIGHGITIIAEASSGDSAAIGKSVSAAEEIYSYLGRTVIIPEKYMDAATAVSGCGPAYIYTMIQAMTDGGVKMGLPRDKALLLAAQTAAGAAMMVLETGEDPISLRGRVTSPGGATIDAVHVLEKAGFSGTVMEAVEAAKIKSEKLGV